jgi:hypothetical protein
MFGSFFLFSAQLCGQHRMVKKKDYRTSLQQEEKKPSLNRFQIA